MGGMTVMAYAEQHPELFGDRIVGVALLSTSPGRIAEVTLGVPAGVARVVHRVAPRALHALSRQAELVERSRRAGSDLSYVLTKRYSFAGDPPPALVEFVAEMIGATPFEVVAEFFPAFDAHDKLHALEAMHDVPALVLVGDSDLMTPVGHSEDIADRLPHAEFVVVDDAAHMAMLEYPDVVNKHLRALVERVRRA
jgi:pimeloyl-ACP methyl ester carboxylesterase